MQTRAVESREYILSQSEVDGGIRYLNKCEKMSTNMYLDDDSRKAWREQKWGAMQTLEAMGIEVRYDVKVLGYVMV